MQTGDMAYYLYTDKLSNQTKYPAQVIAVDGDAVTIRIGRFDVHSQEIKTLESTVESSSLTRRSAPCSYENELKGLS